MLNLPWHLGVLGLLICFPSGGMFFFDFANDGIEMTLCKMMNETPLP